MDKWFHAYPEYKSLWTTLEQLDMDELARVTKERDDAYRQIQEMQRTIESLRERAQLAEQRLTEQLTRPQGFSTANCDY